MRPLGSRLVALALTVLASTTASAQPRQAGTRDAEALASVPELSTLVGGSSSELAGVVQRFAADQTSLERRYDADGSPDQRQRMRAHYEAWSRRLRELSFDKLSQEGRVDYVLLDNYLQHRLALIGRDERERRETAVLVPFADRLLALQDTRRNLTTIDPRAASRTLAGVAQLADSLRARFEPRQNRDARTADSASGSDARVIAQGERGRDGGAPARTAAQASRDSAAPKISKIVAYRAARELDALRATVTAWYRYYDGYDPIFTWWAKDPYRKLDESLTRYARTLRERVVGYRPAEPQRADAGGAGGGRGGNRSAGGDDNEGPIVGVPIGAEGLAEDLRYEMIPYTPEELIAIAEKEYAFSLSEMKKAARQMGFGDDWKGAMEKVKNTYVEPGKQPDLIRDLARQAEDYFDQHDWVTIPPLAREDWRMEMMSPERQRVAPFFLGGESILVSYPTADMSEEDKLMSLRGNNPHFSHATVFHELNPGHHLQGFMTARYNSHRRLFSTPFWNEGQSLYWEMFLWDHGFQQSPEDRVGALFWRMHRSARIIFSLSFHLGKMTPEQAIQFLVDTVNFERANAEGEVRRSFNGSYPPLYQIGYMIGGLQLRALHHELVDSKRMTERQFHDAVLQGGPMPITMVRARLENIRLTRDGASAWRFADQLPPAVPFPVTR